ncbi:DEAH box polypeptide 36 [Cryptococcus gattii Ru294]|nr:DEAH box polypeptide 36 [Cryptococcus gattii Ru294]
MAKKKLSLKPQNRGFATTSLPKKSAPQSVPPPALSPPPPPPPATTLPSSPLPAADWEHEESAEEIALQSLVDRLQDKAEKEVTRIVKAIEYDRRLAASFPKLDINQAIRDTALELALEEEKVACQDHDQPPVVTFPSTSVSESEKGLLRYFIAYHVLQNLGFRQERIEQCLLQGIKEGEGWEEALEWLWLHLSEDECVQQGEYERTTEPSIVEHQESLVPSIEPDIEPVAKPAESSKPIQAALQATDTSTEACAATHKSLFQSQNASDTESDSEADDEYHINEQWAKLQLELDTLRMASGEGKKGKKGKGNQVVIETPEIRRLKDKISRVEKEYMFTRKDANAILKVLKSQRDVAAIAAKFKGASMQNGSQTETDSPPENTQSDSITEEKTNLMDGSSDEEGDLFGGMLDEPTALPGIATETSASTRITVRSMPIPKQMSFAGTIPKNILKAALAKQTKQAVISYVNLSGASRAARAGLEIGWQGGGRRIWKMDDIACDDMVEAENYVSTLALSDLEAEKTVAGVNWRTMPPSYRELWEELKVKRKEREDESRRGTWKMIKGIWDKKAVESIAEKNDTSKSTTGNIPTEAPAKPTKEKENVVIQKLQDDFAKRKESPAYQAMLPQRNTLPIASFRDQIISTLDANQILVFSGETGCGKSTQLPSFILEDQLARGKPCKIVVTEPRRISAISLAQRVSQELGDAPGTVGTLSSLVGYSIRLESKTSANTRLSFVTNGIALRMLESGSSGSARGTAFDEVTHIIVDEVHERSIESDFLLIVLKNLCEARKDLKVVLMSATVDAEKISAFFGDCPFMSVPGRTFPVTVQFLEDAVELAGWHIDGSSPYAIRGRKFKPANQMVEWNEEGAKSDSDPEDEDEETTFNPAKLSSSKYSAQTVDTINILDSRLIPYDLIVLLLEKICFEAADYMPFSQATLVFMPGLAEIRKLNDMLLAHPKFGSTDFVVWPLHSSISSEGQSAVFKRPPEGVRKIVISTNIAETGVTIPDITCVIDTGKQREMRDSFRDSSNHTSQEATLNNVADELVVFRKALRSICSLRLDMTPRQLPEHPIPEMLRLSLQDLALRIKILKVPLGKTVESVLLQALDPPSSINIQRAIASLVEVKALTPNEEITPLGRLLSKLPMDVHLGKFLLVAAMLGCLDPALTIAATLNSKSPFVTPFGFESQARAAKQSFAIGNNDFFTIANVFASWRRASDNPHFVRTFCKKNFVSHQNLQQIEELRQQLLAYLVDTSFVDATPAQRQAISQGRFSRGVRTKFVPVPPELNVNGEDLKVVGAALVSGLYPKLLALDASGGMRTITNQQPVAIHPSSVNFKVRKSEFDSNYLAYFTIMHSKRLYAWETGPVDDTALALLCGDIADFKTSSSSFILDRKIKYSLSPKASIAVKLIREQLYQVMSLRFKGKKLSDNQQRWFELGLKCLAAGLQDEEATKIGVI